MNREFRSGNILIHILKKSSQRVNVGQTLLVVGVVTVVVDVVVLGYSYSFDIELIYPLIAIIQIRNDLKYRVDVAQLTLLVVGVVTVVVDVVVLGYNCSLCNSEKNVQNQRFM